MKDSLGFSPKRLSRPELTLAQFKVDQVTDGVAKQWGKEGRDERQERREEGNGLANDPSFCACPALIETAKKELPDIAAVSKAIPDDFSSACYLLFGWGNPDHPGLPLPITHQDLPIPDARISGYPSWEITRRELLSRRDNITLKMTHMPGVVEHSLRRVKSVSLPTPEGLTSSAHPNICPDAATEGRLLLMSINCPSNKCWSTSTQPVTVVGEDKGYCLLVGTALGKDLAGPLASRSLASHTHASYPYHHHPNRLHTSSTPTGPKRHMARG